MSTRTLRTLTALLVGAIAALAPAALLAALELVMSEARRLRTRAASAEGSGEPQGGAAPDPHSQVSYKPPASGAAARSCGSCSPAGRT